jgi:hypothetical protein
MRSRRTLFLFLGIFAVLLVALALQNIGLSRQVDSPAGDTPCTRTFPDISSPADIQAVRLADPSTAATFTMALQTNGIWASPEHNNAALAGQAGIRIAATIALLPNRQLIPALDQAALTTYGFKPKPQLLIYVLLKNGKTHNAAIGNLSPAQTSYFAIVDNVSGVYVLDRSAVDFLIVTLRNPPVA